MLPDTPHPYRITRGEGFNSATASPFIPIQLPRISGVKRLDYQNMMLMMMMLMAMIGHGGVGWVRENGVRGGFCGHWTVIYSN